MARTREAVRPVPASSNGHSPTVTPGGVSVASPVKRRPAWTFAGAGLVVLAMLLGAWVFASQSSTVSVFVAARDLDAGETIGAADLRVVELSNAGGLRGVQPGQQDLLVGRATRGPVPAGTVFNTGLVTEIGQVIPVGQVVVGVALDPGASPSSHLAAGDRVEVLAVEHTVPGAIDAVPAAASLIAEGSVWAVEPIATGTSTAGRVWVSLLVPQAAHGELAQAASEGRLRLGLLGAGS
jgi:Flp pilus assembly protein CpaB